VSLNLRLRGVFRTCIESNKEEEEEEVKRMSGRGPVRPFFFFFITLQPRVE